MKSKEKLESDLNKLSEAVVVDGVIAAILFGSRARGDYDQYSDYDLLIIFNSKQKLWENFEKLYNKISKTGLFVQAMPVAIEELKNLEETFLHTILQEGIVIFQRYPFITPPHILNTKPAAIITYNLTNLSHKEKLKLNYILFGRKKTPNMREGLLEKLEGNKIGRGAIIIPWNKRIEIEKVLNKFKVKYHTIKVYIQTNNTSLKS
jgi:predicted nucleotidyltransferase